VLHRKDARELAKSIHMGQWIDLRLQIKIVPFKLMCSICIKKRLKYGKSLVIAWKLLQVGWQNKGLFALIAALKP
jgi:hypothetical protein